MEQNVCAGIVLYNPDVDRLRENIESICPQVSFVVLIDNGSYNLNEVVELIRKYEYITLVKNDNNLGIASALNQICDVAKRKGYEWVLTLDQDTVCPPHLIKCLTEHIRPDIGIVCPAVHYEGQEEKNKRQAPFEYVYACMSSASLTNVLAWNLVGGFREDYFIDFVDNEFCMKLRNSGYKILRVNECQISHELGKMVCRKILGVIPLKLCEHSPFRFYYMTRNNIVFIREYREHLFVFKEYLKLLYVLLSGFIASSNKRLTFCNIRKGIVDAKAGKMGKLDT